MAKEKSEKTHMNLEDTLADIRKEFGAGSVIQGQTVVKGIVGLPTGALSLDIALGIGGIPKGRISEIYGPESSGKTTICFEIIAGVQRRGGKAAFIDVEHAVDPVYAQKVGVDWEHLYFAQPDSGEEALTICQRLADSGELDLIVVDSVAALVPQVELDGEITDANMGAQARLMSKALRKMRGSLNKTGTAVLFTNQLREKIGVMFGNPETTPGGKALKFYASVRMDIRRIEGVKGKTSEDGPSGNKVRVTIKKNKVATPFRKAEFEITFGKGINKIGNLIEIAEGNGLIKKAGSSFKYGDKSFAGRAKLMEFIEGSSEVFQSLDSAVRDALKLKVVDEVEEELPAAEDALTVEED